jgi:hypothetical protein
VPSHDDAVHVTSMEFLRTAAHLGALWGLVARIKKPETPGSAIGFGRLVRRCQHLTARAQFIRMVQLKAIDNASHRLSVRYAFR